MGGCVCACVSFFSRARFFFFGASSSAIAALPVRKWVAGEYVYLCMCVFVYGGMYIGRHVCMCVCMCEVVWYCAGD